MSGILCIVYGLGGLWVGSITGLLLPATTNSYLVTSCVLGLTLVTSYVFPLSTT